MRALRLREMVPFMNCANEAAYDLWAHDYPPLPHNPLMAAEQAAVLALWPEVTGRRGLDLACGSGRYGLLMQQQGARHVIGCDRSAGMLARAPLPLRVRADMQGLPFAAASFDLIVCGLAVGHAPSLARWMAEAARVLAPGGVLVYSDFHPDAVRAGMTRSFTDGTGQRHKLVHVCHELDDHRHAATQAGLVLQGRREVRLGHELHAPGRAAQHGLAVVLALRWGKP